MTQREFTKLCRQWQKTLRLQDWIIEPLLVEAKELDPNNWGESHICIFDRSAQVRASDQRDRDASLYRRPYIPSVENTLVHELLEVLMSPMLDGANVSHQLKEATINKLAGALVCLKKKIDGHD